MVRRDDSREGDEPFDVEPLPPVEALRGVHAGRYEEGEVTAYLREMTEEEKQREASATE